MKSIVSTVSVCLVSLLAGCASITSHKAVGGDHKAGISYYLPKRMVRVTFERVQLVKNPASDLNAAEEALTIAERALATAQAHIAQTAARLKSLKDAGVEPTTPVFLGAVGESVDASLKMDAARAAATDAKRKRDTLASAKLEWDVHRNQCGFVDRFSVTVLPPIPDLAHAYVLEPRHSATRTEDFRIKTTTSGLLSTVEGSIEDQTVAIVVALAQGATALKADGFPSSPIAALVRSDFPEDQCHLWKPRRIESIIDPTAGLTAFTAFVEAVNADLTSCGAACPLPKYAVSVSDILRQSAAKARSGGSGGTDKAGIYYRREHPLLVEVGKNEAGKILPVGSFLLALPNGAPAERFPMHSSPFVTTKYDIGLDQGLLVSVDSNRPSEALRIASLPWDVAQATMNVLTSLIRFRVDYTKSDVDLLTQQIEQIKQQQALIEARQRAESPSGNAFGSDTPIP